MSVTMNPHAGIEKVDIEAPEIHPNTPGVYHRENWGLAARVDPSVSFEEYQYWAKIERELEFQENLKYVEKNGPWTFKKMISARFSKGIHHEAKQEAIAQAAHDEKHGAVVASPIDSDSEAAGHGATEEEWRVAARALRTSGWGTVFYLITTDILGWSGTP